MAAGREVRPTAHGRRICITPCRSRDRTIRWVGVLLGGEGGDEWLDGGALTGSRYRCLADAMVHLRFRTASKLAAHYRRRPRAAAMAAAVLDDVVPGPIGRGLVRQIYRPEYRLFARLHRGETRMIETLPRSGATEFLATCNYKFTDNW